MRASGGRGAAGRRGKAGVAWSAKLGKAICERVAAGELLCAV